MNPPNSYELLQELRDISTMAMEHFEEEIVPAIKRNYQLRSSDIRINSSRPRIIRRLANRKDIDSESTLLYPSSSSIAIHPRETGHFVRYSCSTLNSSANSVSNLNVELVLQQHALLINEQKREIMDLSNKAKYK